MVSEVGQNVMAEHTDFPLVGASSNFRTDTDISSGRTVRERDLQKWEGAPDSQVDMSLSGRLDGWDQFAAHKQMTGRDSTYDENNYTTKLDTSAPGYKEKLARAEKIAREIENSTTNNAHQAEERGQISTRDDGIDEEAK
jgi:PAB1-binding protein PBP1